MSKLMISCEKASFLASKSQDVRLSLKERIDMQMHMAGCKFCRFYKKDLDILSNNIQYFKSIIEQDPQLLKLTEEQKERIKEKLNGSEKD